MNQHDLDTLLADFGLFPGARSERAALASRLAASGFKSDWMGLLWAHAKATGKRPDALVVSWLGGDWKVLTELVEDLQAAYRGREARGEIAKPKDDGPPSHYSKSAQQALEDRARANSQTVPEMLAERDEQHAYCRVTAERRTVAQTAQEMGWTEDRVWCAIERWAPYYGRTVADVHNQLKAAQKASTKQNT